MLKKKTTFLFPFFCIFFVYASFAQDTAHSISQDTALLLKDKTPSQHYLQPPALIIPGAFIVYGGLKPVINVIARLDDRIMEQVKTNYPDFHSGAEDYLMWAPSASVYALDAFKVNTAHSFKEHLMTDAGSILITGGIGYCMRLITKNIQAYDPSETKFPSGHTANAFRGAEILHQELKQSHKVWSYSGYVVATSIGLLRIYDKSHYLSEVITGAGLGILYTKLTYWIFNKMKERKIVIL